jgi:hypothetical protein
MKILEKYEVTGVSAHDATDPCMNVPAFILPENFDARTDGLTFDWSKKEDSFLGKV